MKGIILSGGSGTRLNPVTNVLNKQLLPIYNKPMIYYPLSVLMLMGIRDILIITTPKDQSLFIDLLGDGGHIGCNITYKIQEKPNGLAEAFIIGEEFIQNDQVTLILGDNIFYGSGFIKNFKDQFNENYATIFACRVSEPSNYGVVEFDSTGKVISLEEKPTKPKSNYAVPGLYIYDNEVSSVAKAVKPSKRGELEITSINKFYLNNNKLNVIKMKRGSVWFDTGSFDSMIKASSYIQAYEESQQSLIGSIEEIAFNLGYISSTELNLLAEKYSKNEYGKLLKRLLK